MAHKTHDLVVKVGEYQTRDGQTKPRYEPCGALMMGDRGPFVMLKRTFNPAGVPSDRDTILISALEPRDRNEPRDQGGGQRSQQGQQSSGAGGYSDGFSDDIPFAPSVL